MRMRRRLPIALIVDVDNTLFDWVGVWYQAFSALVTSLEAASGIERPTLLSGFRAIHRRHSTTEYPFALLELLRAEELSSSTNGSMRADASDAGDQFSMKGEHELTAFAPELLRSAAADYRRAAEAALMPYPHARETLDWFRSRGTRVIALTETRLDVSGPRLRQLGLDGIIDILYGPGPWAEPSRDGQLALWPYGAPPLEQTIGRPIEPHRKPQPEALRQILADVDVRPHEALYVGDHLHKDIGMAQQADVPVAWARYGTVRRTHELALLHEVCHWSVPERISSESSEASSMAAPTLVIENLADLRLEFDDERRRSAADRSHRRTKGGGA
jgi:phosphoglycolate phosphatase-like HAD superfamily hydrolase